MLYNVDGLSVILAILTFMILLLTVGMVLVCWVTCINLNHVKEIYDDHESRISGLEDRLNKQGVEIGDA